MRQIRVGYGIDSHRIESRKIVSVLYRQEPKPLVLAGVLVSVELSPIAHSDGDVVLHAVTNAIFSAAGKRDIGHYFPDSDMRWHNADSGTMVGEALRIVRKNGWKPVNVAVAIIAKQPRLDVHVDNMVQSLSGILGFKSKTDRVGITVTSGEGVGGAGVGECIEAHATALLRR